MDIKQKIEQANQEAARRLTTGEPVLVDVAPAGEVIPGMEGKIVTHSGPPIEWDRMCGAQQGAIIGMVLYEGWAKSADEARAILTAGEVRLEPNHPHRAVGPMAGTISPSAPVWVVENRAFGNRAFCRQVEPRQQFGEFSNGALEAPFCNGIELGPLLKIFSDIDLCPHSIRELQDHHGKDGDHPYHHDQGNPLCLPAGAWA